jgi:hypothetical protein
MPDPEVVLNRVGSVSFDRPGVTAQVVFVVVPAHMAAQG